MEKGIARSVLIKNVVYIDTKFGDESYTGLQLTNGQEIYIPVLDQLFFEITIEPDGSYNVLISHD